MKTEKTERRIDASIRVMRVGAILCALFAALGIASGIHEANPDSGWLVPAIAGVVAAAAFAGLWHVLIGGVVGMVRTSMIIGTFVLGIGLTLLALGASAQAIATAVSGRSAMSAELSEEIDGFNQALGTAYGEATQWSSVAAAAGTKGTGINKQAEMEATGANGSGKGCGPRCASLKAIGGAFLAGEQALNAELQNAKDIRGHGDDAMATMREAAAAGDPTAFMDGTEGTSQAITKLNAVDPRPIIYSIGAVTVSNKGIDMTQETKDFYETAEKALEGRETVEVPVFVPISLGEATRRQAFGAAMHGWILAGAIDILPLVCLILAFFMSREVWHNERVVNTRLTSEGRDQADRKKLRSMMGDDDDDNVTPFRQAAE